MKKFTTVFFVALMLALFVFPVVAHAAPLHQDAQPPAGGVALPVDLADLLKLVFGLLVTQGLKSLSKLLKYDLSGWGAALTASVTTSVILFFNAILAAVPAAAQPSVAVGLTLLMTILGAFGLKDTLKSFVPAG